MRSTCQCAEGTEVIWIRQYALQVTTRRGLAGKPGWEQRTLETLPDEVPFKYTRSREEVSVNPEGL